MKLVHAFRSMGIAFALVLLGVGAHATLQLPVQGPSLGDPNTNIYTLAQAVNQNNQLAFSPALVANGTTQATCTVIVNPLNNFTTVASNGSVCLPQAFAGAEVFIANAGANTIQLFGSNTPFKSGTQDTINGTTGSTAYTGVTTTNLAAQCFSPANGAWFCSAGH